jgi:hypothetical protein
VHIAFLIAALNELYVKSIDIGNAYLNAYTQKNTTAGSEFGLGKVRKPVTIEWYAQLTVML